MLPRTMILGVVGVFLTGTGSLGCQWSTDHPAEPTSLARVLGGQAVNGSVDKPAVTIGATAMPSSESNAVYAGVVGKVTRGSVGPNATAVAIGVPGDKAYFIVPAPDVDVTNEDMQVFSARYSVSPALADSPLVTIGDEGQPSLPLHFRAVDREGRFGPATILNLDVLSHAPAMPLSVSLEWDGPVDLDLHVESPAPNGMDRVDLWSKMPTGKKGGLVGVSLDMDSNAACAIDNWNRETITWSGVPVAGHYIVRVEPYSLCGQFHVAWHASITRLETGEAPFREASGVLTVDSQRGKIGLGAGLTVLEFDYP